MWFKVVVFAWMLIEFSAYSQPGVARPDTNTVVLNDLEMLFRRISPRQYSSNASDFFLLETEVSNKMYAKYLKSVSKTKGDQRVGEAARKQIESGASLNSAAEVVTFSNTNLLWNGDTAPKAIEDLPVGFIIISDARDFCDWLTKRYPDLGKFRLPTVEEWLMAAYGSTRAYPWGNELDLNIPCVSISCASKRESPDKVKGHVRDKTPEGIYDLGGNAAEWVSDPKGFSREPRWMGDSFRTCPEKGFPSFKPRNGWFGYVHNAESRMEDVGFRVVLECK
jgi:formylglycine-generating enzyme required for sulfatase activity